MGPELRQVVQTIMSDLGMGEDQSKIDALEQYLEENLSTFFSEDSYMSSVIKMGAEKSFKRCPLSISITTTTRSPNSKPAKARKYNFGRPGGPRKSRRSSTRRAPPRRANSVVANDRPSPRLRPATSRCRCCGCARPAAVAAANLRDLGDRLVLSCCVLNAAVVAAIVLRTSPASVVPPCGRTMRPISACPNCVLLLLSLRSNRVVVLRVDFGLSNAPPCA
eukprot:COSAG05_NODE_255_length_12816_cov_13.781631_2_plen_221_part_00